ncbi:MAG: helix-turn-helix transcriptional regulator [Crenarchaeota archaeon]|nr:helix-turn-helix transcriptional regulator [Thermoproteota archaeon]
MTTQPEFDPYEIISHRLRREIIDRLHSRPQTSFSELMKITGENTGSLSFHLVKLEPLIAQNEERKYSLNATGEKMYLIIR